MACDQRIVRLAGPLLLVGLLGLVVQSLLTGAFILALLGVEVGTVIVATTVLVALSKLAGLNTAALMLLLEAPGKGA
jgi:hypothetical protein